MKLNFLALPSDERRLYIEQAAARRNISPVILEKDFWVCWLLGILFESEFSKNLVFKRRRVAIEGIRRHRAVDSLETIDSIGISLASR